MINPDSITWNDFKGVPNYDGFNAQASAGTLYGASYHWNRRHDSVVDLAIWVRFLNDSSWVKRDSLSTFDTIRNAELLLHEINHYRIGIFCFKIAVQIISENPTMTDKRIFEVLNRSQDLADSLGERYDIETCHSTYRKNQLLWNIKIKNTLKALEAYKLEEQYWIKKTLILIRV